MSTSGSARNSGSQNVAFIGKDVTFATPLIGTADKVKVGRIPAGSIIDSCIVRITTAFNAVTTNVLTVGSDAGADTNIVAAGEVNEVVAGTTVVLTGAALVFASDTDIYVRYTQTGTAATTGAATIIITFIPPNW